MVKLETNVHINEERGWLLFESRVFEGARGEGPMLDANLEVIDINTKETVDGIDDVWEYDWKKIY